MSTRFRITVTSLGLALVVGLTACGGSSKNTATESTPTTVAPAAATDAAAQSSVTTLAPTVTTAAAAASTTKVNANTATRAQIVAALTAAGVANPSNWAREVMEYRPYPAGDPNFTSLRDELSKYNPPAGTIDKIISCLTL